MSAPRHVGYSLVELSVALAVLGLLGVGLVSYWVAADATRVADAERERMVNAEQALLGFLYAEHRLPCPASDAGGLEDCSGGRQKGFLPWRTLGLPDAAAGRLRYGVYRDAAAGLDLAVRADRYAPLVATRNRGADEQLLDGGTANLLDVCYALNDAGRQAGDDAGRLHVLDDGERRAMAYALAAPGSGDADGDGRAFDGNQSAAAPAFDTPARARAADYDDRVTAAAFPAIFGYLGCGEALGAIGHTHFNAGIGARFMAIALDNYQEVLVAQLVLAEAGVLSATAGLASATGGLASAVGETALAVAQAIGSYGALSPIIAAGAASIVANTSATITAAASLGVAIAGSVEAGLRVDGVAPLVTESANLADETESNAKDADARGL